MFGKQVRIAYDVERCVWCVLLDVAVRCFQKALQRIYVRSKPVYPSIVLIAHDLLAWMKRLLLTDPLARCEPKRLRYRILHVAVRLAFHARTATLRLQANWPWAAELTKAFERLAALPAPPG